MLVVGLTGGIGCGKSLISELFHKLYAVPVIDADLIAKDLTQSSPVLKAIAQQLGSDFIDENNNLLRDKLRKAVFSDSTIRNKLENILHPLVYDEITRKILELDAEYCLVVIPLLLEKKRTDFIDRILVIDCTIDNQIARVTNRDNCNDSQVEKIIATQIDRNIRLSLADDIIENNQSIESVKEKVTMLHQQYINLSKKQN